MDKALYVAMTGAKQNMLAQVSHSNNLANVNTNGFKSEMVSARSTPVYFGEGQPTRAYSVSENQYTDFSQGALIETGRDLDISVEREGFIAVQGPDGQDAYTRVGSLFIDSVGVLRTGSGLPVLGNGGPIAVPAAEKIDLSLDGTISIIPLGQGVNESVTVDRIRLVNPGSENLQKGTDGLFHAIDPEADIQADADVRIVSGFLEGSNVSAVKEMMSVLNLSRQYEMQVKIMQTVKENSETSAQMMRMS
ncbi:MAG: flagellar basal-body rod protein FlgF [Flavobacteriales bacterium]|jgi:flagellar basal-body rod protein FlgF